VICLEVLKRGFKFERVETGDHAEVAFAHEEEQAAKSEGHSEELSVPGFFIHIKEVIDGKELQAENSSN
jgi:hypothetical protein